MNSSLFTDGCHHRRKSSIKDAEAARACTLRRLPSVSRHWSRRNIGFLSATTFQRLMKKHVQRLRLTGVVFDKLHGQVGGAPNGVELHPMVVGANYYSLAGVDNGDATATFTLTSTVRLTLVLPPPAE
jgi:hypothetical protein